jgi:hypothetical protein
MLGKEPTEIKMKQLLFSVFLLFVLSVEGQITPKPVNYRWAKLSSEYGDIETSNKGKFPMACITADFNKDGKDEFVIVEKTETPSVVMYVHKEARTWEKYEIEKRKIDAGEAIAVADIDGDGDLDLCVGGEDKEIWWWENPYPEFEQGKTWKRNYLKKSGATKHQDIAFGDFDGDGKLEAAFWSVSQNALCVADAPENPKKVEDWPLTVIYTYNTDGQMEQHSNGTEINGGINRHAGIAVADINGDGVTDIVAGGNWFNYSGGKYLINSIDEAYVGSYVQAGQLIAGGRPEIVMVPENGAGPMIMYQYESGVWKQTVLQKNLRKVHSLVFIDFDKDGDIDIVSGEMASKDIPDPKVFILLNDGKGNFNRIDIDSGKEVHMLSVGDIDGDGDYDLIGKPFGWDTPRLDIWLNEGLK